MNIIKHIIFVLISLTSFIFVFYTIGRLMMFLSVPSKQQFNKNESLIPPLFSDVLFLTLFMFQHTLMLIPIFKNFIQKFNLYVISRSIYNLLTALSLMLLMSYWKTTDFVIWQIDTSNIIAIFTYSAIHLFAWSVIYVGCIFMDMSEILGVKQVYYSIMDMPDPMDFKSTNLQRLYGHTRHPSFTAFSIIFWFYPVMSADRFLLALVLTTYMYFAWKTDKYDLHYQQTQYVKKKEELEKLK